MVKRWREFRCEVSGGELTRPQRPVTAVTEPQGMAFCLVVWLVMVPGVAAQAQSSELFVESVPAWAWIAGHLMFGAITAAVFALGRRSD